MQDLFGFQKRGSWFLNVKRMFIIVKCLIVKKSRCGAETSALPFALSHIQYVLQISTVMLLEKTLTVKLLKVEMLVKKVELQGFIS